MQEAQARLREEGHGFTGEVLVVARDEDDLVAHIEHAARRVAALDWRMYDIVIVAVSTLGRRPDAPEPQITRAAERS